MTFATGCELTSGLCFVHLASRFRDWFSQLPSSVLVFSLHASSTNFRSLKLIVSVFPCRTFSGDNASLRRLIVGEPFSMVEKSGQRSGVTIESSTDVNQRVQNIGSILIDELCTRFGLTALTQQAVKMYDVNVYLVRRSHFVDTW